MYLSGSITSPSGVPTFQRQRKPNTTKTESQVKEDGARLHAAREKLSAGNNERAKKKSVISKFKSWSL
jgi:hypothetical protein